MADTDTQAPAGISPDAIARLYQQLTAPPPALPSGTPDDGASPSWTGLLGRALSGGQAPGYQLRGGEADTSGNRALLNFGINTLLASGPHAVRPDLLSSVATGLQGAQESLGQDQSRAGALAAAQFQAQREGRQDQLARIKEAIPLLSLQARLQAAGTLQNPLTPGAAPRANIGAGGSIAPPDPNSPAGQVATRTAAFWSSQGYTPEQVAGIMAGGPGAESSFNPGAKGDGGDSHGLYQHQGDRWTEMVKRYGPNPTEAQQNEFAAWEISPQGTHADVGAQLKAAKTPQEAAAIWTKGFERPKDADAKAAARAGVAGQYLGYGAAPAPTPGQATPPARGATIPSEPPLLAGGAQTAGGPGAPGAPTSGVIPTLPPAAAAASAADVAQIEAGRAEARANPIAPAVQPGAVVTAQAGAATPTVAPIGPLEAASREAYRAAHPFTPSPDQAKTFSTEVDPRTAAGMDRQEQVARNLIDQLTNQYKATGDVKLLTDIATATEKYNTVVSQNNTTRQTQIKEGNTAYNAALKDHLAALDSSYDKAHELKQDADAKAALQTQTAGSTLNEKRQLDDMAAGRKVTDAMDAAGVKAHTMNSGLMQMYPVLDKLPKGGIAALLQARPNLLGPLKTAGVISSDTADAVQLIQGLTSYMATEMKPAGLGSLREYEFDAFRARLPTLLESEAGQKQALAMILNMNDRIQQESQWMRGHFARQVPDASVPGGKRKAYDLAPDNITQMDKELGPIIPHFTGDPTNPAAVKAYRARQIPGRPFYNPRVATDASGQPMRDASGRLQIEHPLDVAPMP